MKRKYEIKTKDDDCTTLVSIKEAGTGLNFHRVVKVKTLDGPWTHKNKLLLKLEMYDSLNKKGKAEITLTKDNEQITLDFLDLAYLRDMLFAMEVDGVGKKLYGTTTAKRLK
jgi:hypothetical protein